MTYYINKNHKLHGLSEPTHTFIVHYNNKSTEINISSKATVKELIEMVKIKVQPYVR